MYFNVPTTPPPPFAIGTKEFSKVGEAKSQDSLCHTGQELVNSWPGVRFPATLSCRAGAVVWLLHLCISMSAMVRQTSLGRRQDSIQYNYWIVLRVMGFHQVQVWVSAVTRPTPGLTILYCSVLLCNTSSGYYSIMVFLALVNRSGIFLQLTETLELPPMFWVPPS